MPMDRHSRRLRVAVLWIIFMGHFFQGSFGQLSWFALFWVHIWFISILSHVHMHLLAEISFAKEDFG